jgi:gluconate 5-dehydrogenase
MQNALPDFSLTGRRALVSGAGRGLGREIAKALASAGAHVWLNGRQTAPLQEAVDEMRAAGLSAETAPFDVTDNAAVEAWFESQPDGIDILVNNATLRDRRPTADLTPDAVQELIEVNALAAYRLTRQAAPGMVARGRGAVLNITSIAGPLAGGADAGYTLAKGGLAAMTRSHAVEFARQGIRVNAIAPGFFATEANEAWTDNPDVTAYLKSRSPMGRWADPREIGGAAVFLCSDAASFITGHTLVVDGGMSVKM